MKTVLNDSLFFSKTSSFLNVYIPHERGGKCTAKTYQDSLTIFRRYITDTLNISIKHFKFTDCTFDLVLNFRNWLRDINGNAPSTVNVRLASIKSYLSFAAAKDVRLHEIEFNISKVPFLNIPRTIRPVIDDPEAIAAFLDAPPNTKTGCRDTMILSVLYDTMIRADELIGLRLRDVQIDCAEPHMLIHGKGKRERIVSLSSKVMPLIVAYYKEFTIDDRNPDRPFIYTVSHGNLTKMSERNLERIIKKYADIARKDFPNLPNPIYPHMLRRTRATQLYRDGVPIEAVATALGHASIQTTRDHYASPSLAQRRETIGPGTELIPIEMEQEWPDDDDELARLCGLR